MKLINNAKATFESEQGARILSIAIGAVLVWAGVSNHAKAVQVRNGALKLAAGQATGLATSAGSAASKAIADRFIGDDTDN
jgi:hypothetical protein